MTTGDARDPFDGGRYHPAVAGFDGAAAAYERSRPEYPPEAVDALARECGIGPGRTVLDLAAGTGKLTRMLAPFGAELIGVEPMQGMRREFAERLPDVRLLDGTAEAIPLDAGSVDAVVVAQAFHWFNADAALRDIHRVIRPGGSLGLVWNVRDESVPWVARLTELIDEYRGGTPARRSDNWRRGFERSTTFSPLRSWSFPYEQVVTVEMFVDRVLSISFIARLPEDERAAVGDRVRELAAEGPNADGAASFVLPHRTDVITADRLDVS
jgi:SAM-dependent methyltransferase